MLVSSYNDRNSSKSLNPPQLLCSLKISNLSLRVRNPKLAGMKGTESVEKCMRLADPSLHPHSSPSHSAAMCRAAAHLWTLLNGAVVWPDSSPLLHFPSNLPAQPSDCHWKAVKTFFSFCIAALFPQHCFTIAIFYRLLYLLCNLHLFFPPRLSIH